MAARRAHGTKAPILLAGLQKKVLHPDVIAYTLDRFEIEIKSALAARHGDAEAWRRQEAALEKKIANLTSALADGIPFTSDPRGSRAV